MGIVKAIQCDNFAQIPNVTARDPRLSPRSLGVLVFIISHSEGWELNDAYVKKHTNLGRDALRTVWGELEAAGYCERQHRVRTEKGHFVTVTTVRAMSVCPIEQSAGGSTAGGLPACGSAAGGEPTTIERKNSKRKTQKRKKTNPPQAVKPQPSAGFDDSLTFVKKFGVDFKFPNSEKLDEGRAVKIAMRERLDAEDLRRVAAEFIANIGAAIDQPDAYFVKLCKNQKNGELNLSKLGEECMPSWA